MTHSPAVVPGRSRRRVYSALRARSEHQRESTGVSGARGDRCATRKGVQAEGRCARTSRAPPGDAQCAGRAVGGIDVPCLRFSRQPGRLSTPVQRLLQVRDELVRVFDADRYSEQVLRYHAVRPLCRRAMLDQALHAVERGRRHEKPGARRPPWPRRRFRWRRGRIEERDTDPAASGEAALPVRGTVVHHPRGDIAFTHAGFRATASRSLLDSAMPSASVPADRRAMCLTPRRRRTKRRQQPRTHTDPASPYSSIHAATSVREKSRPLNNNGSSRVFAKA